MESEIQVFERFRQLRPIGRGLIARDLPEKILNEGNIDAVVRFRRAVSQATGHERE